jgi:hypothetical protein
VIKSDPDRLRAAKQRFRKLPNEVRNDLRKWQRSEASPIWKEEVSAKSGATRLSERVFKSGNTVKAGSIMILRAGGSTKKLSGGASAAELVRPAEFGSNRRDKYTKFNRVSPKGKSHTVTRRSSRQLPHHRRGGYVVFPASTKAIRRVTSLSVQTVTRRIYDSIEGS